MKDEKDRELEALFRSRPIEDAGFSRRVLLRIRRRIWLQRLALPMAVAVGGAVAAHSITGLRNLAERVGGDLWMYAVVQRFAEFSPPLGSGLTILAVALIALMCVPLLEE